MAIVVNDRERIGEEKLGVLFDGGNSRLLTRSSGWESDIMVALPQNNFYDHIKSGDNITIGFEHSSGICFKLDAQA